MVTLNAKEIIQEIAVVTSQNLEAHMLFTSANGTKGTENLHAFQNRVLL